MSGAGQETPAACELRLVNGSGGSAAVGVFATTAVPAGSLLLLMPGDLVARPDRFTIQLERELHLRGSGSMADELRHACEPNARVDGGEAPPARSRALRDIAHLEELTIDYCATEDVLASPFGCACGSPACYGEVRGYRFRDSRQRARLARWASPWLLREYAGAR